MKTAVLLFALNLISINAVTFNEFDDNIINAIGEDLVESNEIFKAGCLRDIHRVFSAWPESWAFQMIDSRGRIPSGLYSGNLISLGQFDQCLAVHKNFNDSTIRGKYCLAKIPIDSVLEGLTPSEKLEMFRRGNVTYRMSAVNYDKLGRMSFVFGICIPESCSGVDIQNLINRKSSDAILTLINIDEMDCSTVDGKPITSAGWVAISLLIICGVLVAASTIYDVVASNSGKALKHHEILIAFSLKTNTQRLITINRTSDNIQCIHGIRTLSMFWVMLGHRYFLFLAAPTWSINEVFDWLSKYPASITLGSTIAVDTFFLISGLLLTYMYLKRMEKEEGFNIFQFYLHRHLRLTPTYAVLILMTAALLNNLATGPVYNSVVSSTAETCQEYWWTALLYIQNYVNPTRLCIGQSWYLAVEMQLYYLSPLLLLPFNKSAKYGLINLTVWLLAAIVTVVVLVYTHIWPASTVGLPSEPGYKYYYAPTHTRAAPWLIGVAMGFLIFKTSKNPVKLNDVVVTLGWIICFVVMSAVVFGLKPLQDPKHVFSAIEDSTYNGLARIGWAFAVSWLIFACAHGYGGPINGILGICVWQILGKLSYSIYLVHLQVQLWQIGQMRMAPNCSHVNLIYNYFGDIFITIVISYFISMMFEAPFLVLEKKIRIFKRRVNRVI